ncbi:hypothetical protein BaRGS_00031872, partial [Batillaria attramentaria]
IAALEQEAADAQKHFKSAKDDANLIFDRLQESLEKQRQETITTLQSQEDELVSGKKAEKISLDCQRAAISTQVHALEQFLTSSPDSTLVGMLNKLKQRLDSLEGQPHARQLVKPAGAWECDVCMVQNTMDAYKCVACESPKPSPKSAGASAPSNTPSSTTARSGRPDARFLTPAGAWECGMGMAQNKEKVSTYFTSESRKPAPKSAGASAPSNTPSSTTARSGRPSAPSNTPSSTTARSGRPSAPSNTPSSTTARSGRPDARLILKPAGAWECGMGMAQNKEKVGVLGLNSAVAWSQAQGLNLGFSIRLDPLDLGMKEIAALEQEVVDTQKHFQTAKDDVVLTFGRLKEMLEKRCQEFITTLQSQEDKLISGKKAEKPQLDQQRAAISTQARSLDQLLASSPDSALVGMLNKLKQRLASLERQPHARKQQEGGLSKVKFDTQKMASLQHEIAALGWVVNENLQKAAQSDPVSEMPSAEHTVGNEGVKPRPS